VTPPLSATLAAAADPVNVTGITAILADCLKLAVLAVAIRALFHAFRSNTSAVLTIVGIVALGVMLWGLGTAGMLGGLGSDFAHAVFKP